MKVSIALPTYNRPEFFREALESCLNQTLAPYEIIIGDDSSGFETEAIVDQYLSDVRTTNIKIDYKHNRPNLGQNANVDDLIKRATGEKFLLLHDDDTLLPHALELMSRCMLEHPDINLVIGKQYITSNEGQVLEQKTERDMALYFKTKEYEGSVLSSMDSAIMQQLPMNGFLVDVQYVKAVGYPGKSIVGNACDFAFGINLAKQGAKFFFLNEFVSTYRLSSNSINRSSKDDWGYESFRILEKLEYRSDKPIDYRKIRLASISPRAIRQAILFNKRKEAIRILMCDAYKGHIFSLGTIKSLLMLARGLVKPY